MLNDKSVNKPQVRPGFGRGPGGHGHMSGMMGPKVKTKDAKGTMKKLWKYFAKQKGQYLLVIILVLGSTLLSLVGPLLIGYGVDVLTAGKGLVDFNKLFTILIWMGLAYLLSALMNWVQIYVMVGVAQDTVWQIRTDLFAKIQTLPLKFFDSRLHGDIMSRLTNDVENINNTLSQSATQLIASIITVLGTMGMMLYLSPVLTLISLIAFPLGMYISLKIAGNSRKYFAGQQKELGMLNGFIEETISGQKVVKTFCREEKSLETFSEDNQKLKKVGIKAQIFSGFIMPVMSVVNNINFAIVAAVGGWMSVKGMITVGVIASFLNYTRQFSRPINEIANQFNMIQSGLAGAERVFEIMDEKPEFEDNAGAPEITKVAGDVNFNNVSFGYKKGITVLKGVNIVARAGQTIALVGPTGAGKTTIVNLLTRFYDIDEGTITVDGKDIRTVEKDSLRKCLGIVLQDTYLFSDTVRENIRYGRLESSDVEVENAARIANADSFILRLPEGYDTVLTEDGMNLSQGQRQLLTIARAILANPAILILDEATSSVDTRTEMNIQKAMLSLMKGRTSFVIAHRLSTIRDADEILVVNGGEIIERGTHKELLEAEGFYFDLHSSQQRKIS
ncbi:MAG: ABC transporter ATP-binding protein [Eubacteriales bacterium]